MATWPVTGRGFQPAAIHKNPPAPAAGGWRTAKGEHVLLLEREPEPLAAPTEVYTRGEAKAAAGDWHSKTSLIWEAMLGMYEEHLMGSIRNSITALRNCN